MKKVINKSITIAPMLDWTDRHCRMFLRLLSPHVGLYTEMVTTGAIIHGDRDRHLQFSKAEHPITLQLGGSNPDELAECAKIGADYGYDGINLNCGCPSDRVQNGNFGACLMEDPALVARCFEKMQASVDIPISIKCRTGIDEHEEFPFLNKFVNEVSHAGCKDFIIHARKAWLQGLSPKENREVPPLRYDIAEKTKALYPHLNITLNGEIKTLEAIELNLDIFDGVMIGREAYQNPWFLAKIEHRIFGNPSILSREAIARAMIPYIEQQQKDYGTPVKSITRHMLQLFKAQPGGAIWRRYLSENACRDDVTAQIIEDALTQMLKVFKTEEPYERRISAA